MIDLVVAVGDVVRNCVVEEDHILRYHTEMIAQGFRSQRAQVIAVDCDRTRHRVIEPR